MRRAVCLAAVAIGSIALHLHAQPQAPQAIFRGGTDLVQVDVSVLDGRRRPVRGLTAADFTIFEDGQRRDIQAFTEVYLPDRSQPSDGSWLRDVPRDVTTNQVAQDEGRLVIVLLDRTIPLGEPTITARRTAAAIINQLGPGDLGSVVSTSNGVVQNLTADRSRLLRAVTESGLSTDISDEAKEIEASIFALTGRTWTVLNDPRCPCGLCVPETIGRVADAVQSTARRRKVLFFIGSDLLLQAAGEAYNLRNDIGCEKRLTDAREAMFAAVDRANLTIHSLDPMGLANVGPVGRASSVLGAKDVGAGMVAATNTHLQRQGNLQVLPDRTGGRAVMNTNGPDGAVPGIFRESDSYYLIGFRPADPSANGKFHQITVQTARRGLDVRARSGYTAPSAASSAAPPAPGGPVPEHTREALTGLLPDGAAPVELNAATFAGPDPRKAAIALTVGVAAFASAAHGGATAAPRRPLEIVAAAFDAGGRPKGVARQTVELSWPAGTTVERRFDALSRLDLPPGEYEIRVAVSGGAHTASVFSYVTVPPFATAPLSLSNIVVGATAGTLTAPRDFLAPLLPVVPTARRSFAPADRAVAFFRIYQGTARREPLAPVELRSSIVDGGGAVVAATTSALDAAQFATGRTADHYVALPLASLVPGEYLLRIETTMAARTAGRALRFVVRQE